MKIGFVGLGNMGGPIALNLVRAGHDMSVHDLRVEQASVHVAEGARWADSPADAAVGADVVLTSLPGPKQVRDALVGANGVSDAVPSGAVVVDLSTNSPSVVRRLGAELLRRDVSLLDAPVSGGVADAKSGTLAIMVGGNGAVFARVEPLFGAIAQSIFHAGRLGSGNVVKLVHNAVSTASVALIAEAMSLGVKAGVSAESLLKGLQDGAYGWRAHLDFVVGDTVMSGTTEHVSFTLRLAHKDLALALELAQEVGVPMELGQIVERDMATLIANGAGGQDVAALFAVHEEKGWGHGTSGHAMTSGNAMTWSADQRCS